MSTTSSYSSSSHGGIMFPLEMFRPRALAQLIGEALVAKVRNVLDAQIELTRHPQTQLVILRIHGSVLDNDPGTFWRENADLALLLSRALPRQVFSYFASTVPQRREGFVVAQQGRALASDDVTADRLAPDAGEDDWPVTRLAQQIGTSISELADGFSTGPRIAMSMLEPEGDDRELLMTLAQPEPGAYPDGMHEPLDDAEGGPSGPGPGPGPGPGAEHLNGPTGHAPPLSEGRMHEGYGQGNPNAGGPRSNAAAIAQEDSKRRANERATEEQARAQRAEALQSDLPYSIDDLGVAVAPQATLEDTDLLAPYIQRQIRGDLPAGIPRDLTASLQGKRADICVRVEFLSEVFFADKPLNRSSFEEHARDQVIGDQRTKALEVFAPRLGPGLLLRKDKTNVFVSRNREPLPESLLLNLIRPEQG